MLYKSLVLGKFLHLHIQTFCICIPIQVFFAFQTAAFINSTSVSTSGVNFTNILQAAFLYQSVLCIFSLITVRLCTFSSQEY